MKRYVFSVLVVVCLASVSFGDVVTFTNGSGTRLWTDPGNWDMGGLANPLPDQNANWVVFGTTNGPIISDGMACEATSIRVANPSGGTMIMTGGTLDLNDWMMVGSDAPDGLGYFTMTGGAITTPVWFAVGFVGEGHFDMSGGTIDALDLHININNTVPGALSTMSMSGDATFIVHNDIRGKLQGFVDDGYLTGAQWSYDEEAGITTITVIPEPATMLLLAMGGVAALRRRK